MVEDTGSFAWQWQAQYQATKSATQDKTLSAQELATTFYAIQARVKAMGKKTPTCDQHEGQERGN
jgi:hypothetical protein